MRWVRTLFDRYLIQRERELRVSTSLQPEGGRGKPDF
jgi:hypothetical protein